MAAGDYRLCDVCNGKAFYDSNLNYEIGEKGAAGFVYPAHPFRVSGKDQKFGYALDYVGDWSVICRDCAATHRTAVLTDADLEAIRRAAEVMRANARHAQGDHFKDEYSALAAALRSITGERK